MKADAKGTLWQGRGERDRWKQKVRLCTCCLCKLVCRPGRFVEWNLHSQEKSQTKQDSHILLQIHNCDACPYTKCQCLHVVSTSPCIYPHKSPRQKVIYWLFEVGYSASKTENGFCLSYELRLLCQFLLFSPQNLRSSALRILLTISIVLC